jgi:thiol-disulfide isomerase/thioredoxin
VGLAATVVCIGCSSSSDPAQSERPKYEVAEEPDAGTAAAPGGRQPGAPVDDPLGAPAGQPGGLAGTPSGKPGAGGPTAPAQPPALSSDQLAGGTQVQVPDGTPQELLDFIKQVQQQVEQLGAQRPAPGTENAVLAKLRSLCEAEVEAADKILAGDPELEIRRQAADARMHGMRFLTMIDPTPERMKDLRTFAQKLATDSDPELSLQGRVIMLGLRIGDLRQKPNPDIEGLVDELEALLSEPARGRDVLNVAQQAYMTLQMLGHHEQADKAFKLTAEAFKDHENPQLAQEAANMFKELEIRQLGLDTKLDAVARGEPDAEQPFLAAVKKLLEQPEPGEMVLNRLLRAVNMLEQTGHYDLGIQLCQLIRSAYQQHPDSRLQAAANNAVDQALKRLQLVGEPLSIEGTTLEGTPLDFSKYQGKVVLVDFWATWCGPCLAELPNLRKNYERYHEAGFDIIGVNLDRDRSAVTRFLETEQLPWVTIVNDELAQRYGVESIPFVVLLNRDGVVVDLHLRGEQLDRRLAELLGPVKPKSSAQPSDKKPSGKQPAAGKKPAGSGQ